MAAVTACSGSSSSTGSTAASGTAGGSTASGGTLTLGLNEQVSTVNPGLLNNGPTTWLATLAYDPLVKRAANGTLQPDLATKWGYVGSGNTDFSLTLRSGVKFSDGEPLTAAAVASSIEYFKSANGPIAGYLANFKSVTATGPLTVDIKLSSPNPVIADLFTQDYLAGDIISPKGVANAKSLGDSTMGAGPYELDSGSSITGSTYTYVKNPDYFDPAAQHYSRVVVKIVTNPNSLLSAVQTGQVDVAFGDPSTYQAAQNISSLKVQTAETKWNGVQLVDRLGKTAPALGSQDVRQALNYAIDRTAITKAVYGTFASPTSQINSPGWDGYDTALNDYYPYNVSKAKQLLAAAGYPSGFSFSVVDLSDDSTNLLLQAMQPYLKAVGVTMNITTATNVSDLISKVYSLKYAGFAFQFDGQVGYLLGDQYIPVTGSINPFKVENTTLTSLFSAASVASAQAYPAAMQAVQGETVKLAWYIPVATVDTAFYSDNKVSLTVTSSQITPDPVDIVPAN